MSASVVWLPVRLVVLAPTVSRMIHEVRPTQPGSEETEAICVPAEPGPMGRFACRRPGPSIAAGNQTSGVVA
jgi:hypothetical protein